MPETKSQAEARARKNGFPLSQVVKADSGEYFIAPKGIKKQKARKAYANCRAKGGGKGVCAAVAWKIEEK